MLEQTQSSADQPPNQMASVRELAAQNRIDDIMRLVQQTEQTSPGLADLMLSAAITAQPHNPVLRLAYCDAAEKRGDWPQAASRWAVLRRNTPRRIEPHLGFINAQLQQRAFVEAERATLAALDFLGEKPQLREIHARIAEDRGDWAEAARRWTTLLQQAPNRAGAAERLRHASAQAEANPQAAGAHGPAVIEVPSVAEADRGEIKKLLMGFESLGRNCEFGILQRQFEGEPLGLLRFAVTNAQTLLKLLRTRFAGVGDPDENHVVNVKGEYMLQHKSSSWRMHTRVRWEAEPDAAKVLKEQCRHSAFLRNKLIKDLERQSKIFVYWKDELADHEISKIYEAVQDYGPNMLLCVRLADSAHPAGAVEWRGDRLMVAALDRQGSEFRGAGWDVSADYWVHFCRLARERADALKSAADQPVGV